MRKAPLPLRAWSVNIATACGLRLDLPPPIAGQLADVPFLEAPVRPRLGPLTALTLNWCPPR